MSRPDLVLDRFAARQFDLANQATATTIDFDPVEFTRRVNEVRAFLIPFWSFHRRLVRSWLLVIFSVLADLWRPQEFWSGSKSLFTLNALWFSSTTVSLPFVLNFSGAFGGRLRRILQAHLCAEFCWRTCFVLEDHGWESPSLAFRICGAYREGAASAYSLVSEVCYSSCFRSLLAYLTLCHSKFACLTCSHFAVISLKRLWQLIWMSFCIRVLKSILRMRVREFLNESYQ
jgi:hypothetical protein